METVIQRVSIKRSWKKDISLGGGGGGAVLSEACIVLCATPQLWCNISRFKG